ncbi:hypothetical protein SCLCIDRAFT_23323 [Scleroderma citrinum Foug A]|uniref:Uncharacterized protein n=1 Tax=Scleroderma citrinum Foug A TaxID=1036808 RepID=A0A0C3AI78_9AGAM|nr:hypothetical protein SCLCIDRAFT_23323 [Scleroderma citrinum Foug A]
MDWMLPSPTSTSIDNSQPDRHFLSSSLPFNPLVTTPSIHPSNDVTDADAMSMDSDGQQQSNDQLPALSAPQSRSSPSSPPSHEWNPPSPSPPFDMSPISSSQEWMPPSPPMVPNPPTLSSSQGTQSQAWVPPSPPTAASTSNLQSPHVNESQLRIPPSPPTAMAKWILPPGSPSSTTSSEWVPPSPMAQNPLVMVHLNSWHG